LKETPTFICPHPASETMPSQDITENPEEEVEIEFKPIVQLQPVEVQTLEDDEEEVFKQRAKLFRFDNAAEPPEWKERGLGDMRILKHKKLNRVRLIMRREKTLKIACNHYLTRAMKLKPHAASERAFVWTTLADFADEEPKQELLAIRLKDAQEAKKFLTKFEELQKEIPEDDEGEATGDQTHSNENKENESTDKITDKLDKLSVAGDSKNGSSTEAQAHGTGTSGVAESSSGDS